MIFGKIPFGLLYYYYHNLLLELIYTFYLQFMIRGKDQDDEILDPKNRKRDNSEWVIGGVNRQAKK